MGNTGIVPELHWHMQDRGHHGNISLESNDADCSVRDAVGMLVARCGEVKAVSVSCGKRGKFVGLVCGLWVVKRSIPGVLWFHWGERSRKAATRAQSSGAERSLVYIG